MTFAISYGIGASAFLALIALILIKRAPRGRGIFVLSNCVITLFWLAASACQSWWNPPVAHFLESLSFAGWVILLARMIWAANGEASVHASPIKFLTVLAPCVAIACFVNDARFLFGGGEAVAFWPSQIIARVGVAVCGILLVENLYRNTALEKRWHIFPFCTALGFGFAYNLFVFCEAVVLKNVDPPLLAARGVVWALVVPLLALTMARNADWQIDVHVSRKVAFHGATLTAGGVFLLLAAGVATQMGRLPGEWGAVSKVLFFSGSILVLLIVLSAGTLRARVRKFIAENFYSSRYDYRVEWLRSLSALSASNGGEALSVRALRTIASVVNSPGGILWTEAGQGVYSVTDSLNTKADRALLEAAAGPFVAGFGNGSLIQQIDTLSNPPAWAKDLWLAIPLTMAGHLSGFVAISRSSIAESLDLETTDLLLALGQQVAAFIAQERSSRALMESQALIDYSKRFSFIAHDIKNVAGQLTLAVKNIAEFGDEPEFRIDLVASLKNSIGKLNALLARLRPETASAEQPQHLDVMQAIQRVISESHNAVPVRLTGSAHAVKVHIVPSTFQAALSHLLRNAIEASEQGNEIFIDVQRQTGRVVIEIEDNGRGMTREFIQGSLFAPTRSTKSRGHGIGAYQARELIRAAGGEIQVTSEIGVGTRVSIILSDAENPAAEARARRIVA
jgi:putative PEP-CTERM system histidine kinase